MMSSYIFLLLAASTSFCQIIKKQTPLLKLLDNGLSVGDKILISGRVLQNATPFAINLRQGWDYDEGGIIVFHFKPHFDKRDSGAVVCDTRIMNVGWTKQERTINVSTPFPSQTGNRFLIEISCREGRFIVSVDKQPFISYKYRLPLNIADTLEIRSGGNADVEIFSVKVKKDDHNGTTLQNISVSNSSVTLIIVIIAVFLFLVLLWIWWKSIVQIFVP